MSFFQRDLNKEQILSNFLDEIYESKKLKFTRVGDLDLQHKGVDLIFEKDKSTRIYIDEKSQLDYLNADLPTFTFEISYLKNNILKQGWLFDENKITDFYFLVTGIYVNNKSDLNEGFIKCKITSVNRSKLIKHLNEIGLTGLKLKNYQDQIRSDSKSKYRIIISELDDKKQGCIYYSTKLSEKPINLQLRLNYLIEQGIAKRIN